MKIITSSALLAAMLLSACGMETTEFTPDEPRAPTISSSSVNSARAGLAAADNVGSSLPLPLVGEASYSGRVVSDITIDGNTGHELVGTLNMNVDYGSPFDLAPTRALRGRITNLNIVDGNRPVEGLNGSLTVSGVASESSRAMSARARGTLNGTFGDGELGDVVMDANMSGNLRGSTAKTIVGSIRGSGTGSNEVRISGGFYANK